MKLIPADSTRCPCCGLPGDIAFNYRDHAWAGCSRHNTRWAVTRRLGGLAEDDGRLMDSLVEVAPTIGLPL